jgi:predicted dehydrogenase
MDAVVIATPIGLHAEHTLKALESRRHVLCEQTAAYTLADCERIVKAVKKSGLQYMMAENYCYFHYIRQWREMVDRGEIGSVYYAEGEYLHPIIELLVDEKTGKFHWRHERPPIWYCAHTLGPVLTLMRDRVVKACGLTSGFTKMPQYKEHPGFLDFEIGLFRTEKGAVVKILRSQVCSRPHTVWYSLYGTKGHLESQRDRGDGLFFKDGMERHGVPLPCSITDPDAPPEAKSGGHGTSEYFMIRDFLDALEANRRPEIDVIRAMDFTVPGLIAHESAMKNGTWLDVPLFNW